MHRLRQTDLAAWRESQLLAQSGVCALCGQPLAIQEAVGDHAHFGEHAGKMRGVLHRGCNAALGKIENSMRINRISLDRLNGIIERLMGYVQSSLDVYHPSYRTDDEKRARRNKRARRRRRAKE